MPTTALVGVTGGAGTTRTAVEFAGALARDGRTVVVIDAAYATQGLSEYVDGRIPTDVTAVALDDDRSVADATYELTGSPTSDSAGRDGPTSDDRTTGSGEPMGETGGADADDGDPATGDSSEPKGSPGGVETDTGPGPDETPPAGRAAVVPAAAPFERFARAKSETASQRLETVIETAADRFDHTLLDVPPVGANPHVACVTTADRIVTVAPGTSHGADAHRRLVDRLADLDRTVDATVGVRGSLPPADATLPEAPPASAAPTALGDDHPAFAERVIAAAAATLAVDLDIETPPSGPLDRVRDALDGG